MGVRMGASRSSPDVDAVGEPHGVRGRARALEADSGLESGGTAGGASVIRRWTENPGPGANPNSSSTGDDQITESSAKS